MKRFYLLSGLKTSRRCFRAFAILSVASTSLASSALAAESSTSGTTRLVDVRLARVDEFDIVPMGHSLYRDLASVQTAGWIANKGALKTALTRYEIAVDTAKAIVMVTAKREADKSWSNSAPRPALRSLRTMTQTLRAELTDMGVDVSAALRMLNETLQPKLPSVKTVDAVTTSTRAVASPASPRKLPEVNIQLSQRLRLSAALSALARETSDPLGDSGLLGVNQNTAANTRVELGVGNRLTLHAGVSKRDVAVATSSSSLPLQALRMPVARELSTRGGGLNLRVSPSMTFSGQVESVEAEGAGNSMWKRYSGGVGLSAWQNRLTLRANLSRLVPEDVRLLPSTMADLGVGFDVNERTRLSLLYQQLFSVTPEESNRYLAGGISISF